MSVVQMVQDELCANIKYLELGVLKTLIPCMSNSTIANSTNESLLYLALVNEVHSFIRSDVKHS